MSLRVRLFSLPLPAFVRKACLRRLARLTANAFRAALPLNRGLSCAALLDRYAAFTAGQGEALVRFGTAADRAAVEDRLFSGARELGCRLRSALGIRRPADALAVARVLYRMISVDFRGSAPGRDAAGSTFVVHRCFFSFHYSPSVCGLISQLDAGLLAGLSGGKGLVFTRRITEGAAFCTGVLA